MKAKFLKFIVLPVVMGLLVQVSCKKDKQPGSPLIFISPDDMQLFAKAGDVVGFTIDVTSEAGLESFSIDSKIDDGKSFTQNELLESFSGAGSYHKLYEMNAPPAASGSSVVLTFTATDVDGQQTLSFKRIWVIATVTLLTETTGHIMYSHNSQNADAYNLALGVPVISKWSTDSTERDIQDYPLDSTTTVLSRTWISPAGGSFVKFNGFDYANATDSSAAQAFNAGLAQPQVNEIMAWDVILFRFEDTTKYAVIQVTAVNDIDSTASQDSYVFNIKR